MLLRTTVCLLLCSIISPVKSIGQKQRELDSLLTKLEVAKEDTTKVLVLLSLSDYYETYKQDSSLYYLEKVRELSERLNYSTGLYKYHEQSSITFFTKGDYQQSMEHSDKAFAIANEMKNEEFMINTLNNRGILYQYLGKFDKQLEYALQVLALVEKKNDIKKLSSIYHNVGNSYLTLKQYRKSLHYCWLALSAAKANKTKLYTNRIYASIGQNYDYLNLPDSALYFYNIGVTESMTSNDKYAEAAIYSYMSDVYSDKNDFRSMLNVSRKSLTLSRELQSRQMLAISLYDLAYAHYYNHDQEKARINIYEALEIAEADTLLDELKNIYNILSYISAQDGDYITSLRAKFKSDSLQTAVLNQEVIQATSEFAAKYETEKRDVQIKLQEAQIQQKNTVTYILFGAIISILVFSVLAYRNYKHRQKLQQIRISELETEKQLSATEAVLKGEEQERTRLAKDLHDGLGGMLSGIKYSFNTMKENLIMTPENHQAFERSMDMLDSSIKEMRRVAHNMMPESLIRFGLDTSLRDFCNDINQSGALGVSYQSINLENVNLQQTTSITIYRIVQELINNILKHASAKSAIVQVTNTAGHIAVTVEDDGKGFNTAILKESKGIGWTNIQHRLDFIKAKLDVSSQPGKGTSVHIEFDI